MATIYNIGKAQAVPQISTITIAGTPAATDTVWVECDGKRMTMTAGSTMDTAAEFAAGLVEALKATQHDPQYLDADMTINAGGYEYPQFRDMKFSASAGVVSVESVFPGHPFVITVGDTGTTTATLATPTAATGPHFFNAAANYSTGTVPSAADTIVYDERSASTYFALDNTTDNLSIETRDGFKGNIGLPSINANHGTLTYPEYRQTHLDTPATTSTYHVFGEEGGHVVPAGHRFIDMGVAASALNSVVINNAPLLAADGASAIRLKGGPEILMRVTDGGVSIGLLPSDTASVIKTLIMSRNGRQGIVPTVRIGPAVTWDATSTPLRIEAGTVFVGAAGATGPTVDMYGGLLVQSGALQEAHVRKGARLEHIAGDIAAVFLYGGGEWDSRTGYTGTATAFTAYSGFTLRDKANMTFTGGIDFVGCTPADGTFDVEAHQTWTPTAI